MNKIYLLLLLAVLAGNTVSAQQAFTKGNLVVYKVNTNPDDTLSSAPFPVSIDEFTPAGTFVQSHFMPVTLIGNNRRLVASGSATSEGQLTRSEDKRFLLIPGYDTFPDPARTSITGAPATVVNRVVGIMGADGTIDVTTGLKNTYSGNNFRGVASTNGTDLWLAGTSGATTNGLRYTKKGLDTSMRLSSTVTNIRCVNIFNGQLYCTTGSGTFKGICTIGTGTPVDSMQTITLLNGMDTSSGSTADPYAFSIKPGAGDVLYLADVRSKRNGGGVQKWVKTSGKWNLAYTLDSGLTTGLRSLVVDWSTTNPTIYAVNSDATRKDSVGNKIVKTIDVDSTAEFEIIATADKNSTFRGIAFAPETTAITVVYTFTGSGNWTLASNWSNNTIPPTTLPAGSEIIINHSTNGNCVLNSTQTISSGAKLTINTGKNITVPGVLDIK